MNSSRDVLAADIPGKSTGSTNSVLKSSPMASCMLSASVWKSLAPSAPIVVAVANRKTAGTGIYADFWSTVHGPAPNARAHVPLQHVAGHLAKSVVRRFDHSAIYLLMRPEPTRLS